MNYDNEVWKPVPGYEGHYEVSDMGRVRSLNRGKITILKLSKNKQTKYYYVALSLNGKQQWYTVHSCVYAAFKGKPQNGFEIDHKDGNRLNNIPSNLRLLTHRDNIQAGFDRKRKALNTTSVYPGVIRYVRKGIPYFKVTYLGNYIANFKCEYIAGFVAKMLYDGIISPEQFKKHAYGKI